MAALPYMQLYVADYLSDTMHLSAEEHGAYLLLLMNYWQTGKPLSNDDRRLANISRLSLESWQAIRDTILEYFVVDGGVLKQPRMEADLEEIKHKQEQAAQAGKASARARKLKNATKERTRQKSVDADDSAPDITPDSTDVPTDVKTNDITSTPTEHQRNGNHIDIDLDTDTRSFVAANQPPVDNSLSTVLSAKRLARHLHQKIIDVNPDSKANPSKWVSDLVKAIDIDERKESALKAVIDWVFTQPQGRFWIPNIQSGRKLREQFDQLVVRMNETSTQRMTLPKDDNALQDFAKRNGFRAANPGETYPAFRRYLQGQMDRQHHELKQQA